MSAGTGALTLPHHRPHPGIRRFLQVLLVLTVSVALIVVLSTVRGTETARSPIRTTELTNAEKAAEMADVATRRQVDVGGATLTWGEKLAAMDEIATRRGGGA